MLEYSYKCWGTFLLYTMHTVMMLSQPKSMANTINTCNITNHSFDDTQSNAVLHFIKSDCQQVQMLRRLHMALGSWACRLHYRESATTTRILQQCKITLAFSSQLLLLFSWPISQAQHDQTDRIVFTGPTSHANTQ